MRYVLAHYRVVAVDRGEERLLKFGRLNDPDTLSDVEWAWVGGAVRAHHEGVCPTDIDVFVFDAQNHARLVQTLELVERPESGGMVYELDTGEVSIDVVHLASWDSPAACSARADFDIAAGVYCAGAFLLPEGYEEAIRTKMIRFLGMSENPQLSYGRYMKYNHQYGYRIDSSIQDLLRLWQEQTS